MAKIVRYNGGTQSYYGCSKPINLVVGKEYEVTSENDRGFQTDYTLKGEKGYFNSCWFDKVDYESSKYTFMAFSHRVPTIGERYDCTRLEFTNGNPKMVSCITSSVKAVIDVGDNFYKVITYNSIYLVKVE